MLIDCHANATHTLHFPSSENSDGREEILDTTLLTNNKTFRVENWIVSEQRSVSIYSWVFFSLILV